MKKNIKKRQNYSGVNLKKTAVFLDNDLVNKLKLEKRNVSLFIRQAMKDKYYSEEFIRSDSKDEAESLN